jgi:hypothetical protein
LKLAKEGVKNMIGWMKKLGAKQFMVSCLVLAFSLLTFSPAAYSEETSSEGGNWFSRVSQGVSDMFSELNKGDLGNKPKVRPHFSAGTGYLSDADLSTGNSEAAWQARVAPGVAVSIPVGQKLYNEVDYTFGWSTTQGQVTSNTPTHSVNVISRYELSKDTTIGLGNNLQWSEDPTKLGDTYMLETASGEITHRISEKMTGRVGDVFQYYDDATKTGGDYREQDFRDNGVSGSLSYEVTEKLSVGPEFGWHVREFLKVREKDYWQIQPALSGSYKLGPKTTLYGNFGWALRNFDIGGNQNELTYGASLAHALGKKLVWGLNYQKSIQDTFNTAYVLRQGHEFRRV